LDIFELALKQLIAESNISDFSEIDILRAELKYLMSGIKTINKSITFIDLLDRAVKIRKYMDSYPKRVDAILNGREFKNKQQKYYYNHP